MKRFIFFIITLLCCVSLLSVVTFATDINLSNFQLSSVVKDGVSYVTAGNSPLANGWVESLGDLETSFNGNITTLNAQDLNASNGQIQLSWYPFGAGNLISVSQFKASYPINFVWGGSVIFKDCKVQRVKSLIKIEQYNANGRWFGTLDLNINSAGTCSYIPNWSDQCAYIVITYYQVDNISSIGANAYLTFSSGYDGGSSISFAVPNSTDDILGVLTGDPGNPIVPSGSDGISDLESAENDLLSGVNDTINRIDSLANQTLDFFTSFTGAFAFCSALIGLFLGHIGAISSLWYISLSFGIFAALVGIIGAGISARDRRERQIQRKKGG